MNDAVSGKNEFLYRLLAPAHRIQTINPANVAMLPIFITTFPMMIEKHQSKKGTNGKPEKTSNIKLAEKQKL